MTAEEHTNNKKSPWERKSYNKYIFIYLILKNKKLQKI